MPAGLSFFKRMKAMGTQKAKQKRGLREMNS